MLIELKEITKTFIKDGQRIEVLKGLNLRIAQGEALAFLGVSGAGKSTLLHILGVLDHPTSGSLLYDGANVFEWSEGRRAQFRNRKIGFVFQVHNLLPEFTSLENTMMPALIGGAPKRQARRKAEGLLDEVGLSHRLAHRPGELSGGEQQRVAVARAMMMEPEVLLTDEPTGNLDRSTGKKIEDILIALNESKGITLVVVTHNRQLADRMSRCIGLQDGKMLPYE
ncbi:MAG: ABC transporter ATP-binding protein [Deltaproteobacteria bacterium]|nr:ABC transporter ATP-binding protein [Deltaproteobacteria bacterium]